MASTLLSLLLKKRDDFKKSEFEAHIEQMERMLLESKVVLDTKAAISQATGIDPPEHEIDAHVESVYQLESFTNLLRAQMLVSICGYFEYAAKKIAAHRDCPNISAESTLEQIISLLSRKKMKVIDSTRENTLNEYGHIRNACTHKNISSAKPDRKIASAEKYLGGIKVVHYAENGTGKGKIELDNTFLPKALKIHFDTSDQLHKHYAEKS